jgi:hypothetical protein
MIIIEANKANLSDVPFTNINFNGFDVPHFSEEAVYEDVFFKPDAAMSYWFGTNAHTFVFLKLKTTFNQSIYFCVKDEVGNVIGIRNFIHTIKTVGNWTYSYVKVPPLSALYEDKRYLAYIEKYTTEYVPIMVAPIRQLPLKDFDKYLVFNYWNYGGDILDFSFSTFNTLNRGSFGSGNNGLTYVIKGGIDTGASKVTAESESFRDQRFIPHMLTAHTGKTATLTIGDNRGVPEYVAEYINNILCCDTVYLNGQKIVRSGNSVPETKQIAKGYPFVTISVDIEYVATELDDFKVINA